MLAAETPRRRTRCVTVLRRTSWRTGRTTGLEHLAKLPNLKTIHLGRANTESLVPLMKCKTLERLEYFSSGFSELRDEGVVGLEQLTNLQHLTLVGGRRVG